MVENTSIFQVQSIDRKDIHWEDHILDLSPVETIGGIQFKREDRFAPLGYGGINGSKLRVCIWLIDDAKQRGATGIIHGAVTGSPQHPMTAIIGKHFGMPVRDIVGTTKPLEHDMLKIANDFGATFVSSNIGYARNLERIAFEKREYTDFVLETNITVDERRNSAERVEAFHRVGSEQVRNIPDSVETIIVPAGSCNSVLGVLYGIARFKPKGLKQVVLFGIGSWGSKDPGYIYRRMDIIGKVAGIPLSAMFTPIFINDRDKEPPLPKIVEEKPWNLIHYNVNKGCGSTSCTKCFTPDKTGELEPGYCEYNDLMPFSYQGLVFHARYEGKVWHYMQDHLPLFRRYFKESTLFWIVGGGVNPEVLKKFI